MLGDRLAQHPEAHVYLVNTGWTGGVYGIGQRLSIAHTRRMVSAALNGELDTVNYTPHPIFKVLMPDTVPGVPSEVLNPHRTWDDLNAYNAQAQELARRFKQNFDQFQELPAAIAAAAPDPTQVVTDWTVV
jgi:phosphoenolpyruvate carboxykinase (ATP)